MLVSMQLGAWSAAGRGLAFCLSKQYWLAGACEHLKLQQQLVVVMVVVVVAVSRRRRSSGSSCVSCSTSYTSRLSGPHCWTAWQQCHTPSAAAMQAPDSSGTLNSSSSSRKRTLSSWQLPVLCPTYISTSTRQQDRLLRVLLLLQANWQKVDCQQQQQPLPLVLCARASSSLTAMASLLNPFSAQALRTGGVWGCTLLWQQLSTTTVTPTAASGGRVADSGVFLVGLGVPSVRQARVFLSVLSSSSFMLCACVYGVILTTVYCCLCCLC